MAFNSSSAKSALLAKMDSIYGAAAGDGVAKRAELADVLVEWLSETVLPSLEASVTIGMNVINTTGTAAAQTGPTAPVPLTGTIS